MKYFAAILIFFATQTLLLSQKVSSAYTFGFEKTLLSNYEEGKRSGQNYALDNEFKDVADVINKQHKDLLNDLSVAVGPANQLLLETARKVRGKMDNSFQNGDLNGFQVGCENAKNEQWNLLHEPAYLKDLKIGETIDYSPLDLANDCSNALALAKKLGELDGKNKGREYEDFAAVLLTLNLLILEGLNNSMRLSEEEKMFARRRYAEIHDALVIRTYSVFIKILKTKQVYYRKKVDTFPAYYATESVELLLHSFWQNLSTTILTYIYEDCQRVTSSGLGWNGSVQSYLQEKLIPQALKPIFDGAMQVDFDRRRPSIEKQCGAALKDLVIETRTEKYDVSCNIRLNLHHKIELNNEMKAIIEVGLLTQKIRCETDHQNREIRIILPKNPHLLQKTHHDYSIRSSTHSIEDRYRIPNTIKPVFDFLAQGRIAAKVLSRKKNIHSLSIAKNPLSQSEVLSLAKPILESILEPCLALPHSDYKINIVFE
jgi:hypothetical protein